MENKSKRTIGTARYLDPASDEILKDIYTAALGLYDLYKESESLILSHIEDKNIPLVEYSLFNASLGQTLENTAALLKGIAESFDKTRRR